jgi:RNA polymerase sigma-70 factor (ECF subfamily)
LYRITINICLRAKKYSDQKQRRFVKLESISIENIAEKDITEEKEILFNRLSECIKMLEGVDKSIILLHLEGLPYKDIARISGLTENHVAVKIKRIKNRLQTSLKPLNNYGK